MFGRGIIVRCKMITSTKKQIPNKDLCEKDTSTHYISYSTLVSFVAYVRVEISQLYFWWISAGNKAVCPQSTNFLPKNPEKSISYRAEKGGI